jgi:hypothetical protein
VVRNGENNSNGSRIQHYLCTDYSGLNHCDPSLSELRSFEVRGEWSEIYRS